MRKSVPAVFSTLFITLLFIIGTTAVSLAATNTAPVFVKGSGITTSAIGSGNDQAYSVATQADGKIVAAGYSYNGSNTDIALARYNSDGSLDPDFGLAGLQITAVGPGDDQAFGVVIQTDGKIVVAGYCYNGSNNDICLARYNSDGSLDENFGNAGTVLTGIGTRFDYGRSVLLQDDGKIVVAGYTTDGIKAEFVLLRYESDGTLDDGFGTEGVVRTAIGANAYGYGLAIDSMNNLLVSGYAIFGSREDIVLARYTSDGSLDGSFGSGGVVTTTVGETNDRGYCVTVQGDGSVVVAGSSSATSARFVVIRYSSTGSLDPDFGSGGIVTTMVGAGNSFARSVAMADDDQIVVAGYTNNSGNNSFAVVRYTNSGTLDSSFSATGIVMTPVATGLEQAHSVVLQPGNRILIAGYSYPANADFTLVRYLWDGTLDPSFGAPVPVVLASEQSYTAGSPPVVLDPAVAVFDVELSAAGNYGGATLALERSSGKSGDDIFAAAPGGTLSELTTGADLEVDGVIVGQIISNSGGGLLLGFNSSASRFLVNRALQQIAYRNNLPIPPASVEILWTFDDGNAGAQGEGGALAVTGTTSVTVSAVAGDPVAAVSLSADPVKPAAPGASVTFTAAADGGSGSYEYRFLLKTPGGTLMPVADYGSATTWTWETAGLAVGTYQVVVYARNTGSSLKYEAYKSMNYKLYAPTEAVTLTPSVASPGTIGTWVTFTAGASGGSGVYQYKFLLRGLDGVLNVVREYAAGASWSWNTSELPTGTYQAVVYARNFGSTKGYEAFKSMNYKLVGPVSAVTLTPGLAAPQMVGTTVTFSAVASGGSGSYQYKYLAKAPGGELVAVRDYTLNPNWSWNTTGKAAGTWQIVVYARNVGSSKGYEAFKSMNFTLTAP